MEINKAEFVISLPAYGTFPGEGLSQIAVAGRSNVGKSSLINCLCLRRGLAKTSSTPGKTRLINVFLINDAFHLIDLPGYGFANVNKGEKVRWGKMMEGYFSSVSTLKHVFQLVDIRHEPSQDDRDMIGYLRSVGIPFTIIVTKVDKISRGARMKYIAPICRALLVQPWEIIPFSSESKSGREELLKALEGTLMPNTSTTPIIENISFSE